MLGDMLQVAVCALLLWVMALPLPIALWNASTARRDPHRWLRRRGVTAPADGVARVFLARGWVESWIDLRGSGIVIVAVTPSTIVVESQWPLVLWRRRVVIPEGTTLRSIDGRIVDPKRRCFVSSTVPQDLISALRGLGWRIKDVPF